MFKTNSQFFLMNYVNISQMLELIQGVPEKCKHIKNNSKRSVLFKFYYFKCVKIITNDSLLFFSLPVLKMTPILIQTLLTTPSNGIAHVTS